MLKADLIIAAHISKLEEKNAQMHEALKVVVEWWHADQGKTPFPFPFTEINAALAAANDGTKQ